MGLLKIYQNRGKQKRPKYSTYNIKDSHVDTRHNTGSTVRHLSIRIRFTKGKKHPRVAVVNKRNDPAIVIFICCWTRSELKEQVISSHQGRPQREAGLRQLQNLRTMSVAMRPRWRWEQKSPTHFTSFAGMCLAASLWSSPSHTHLYTLLHVEADQANNLALSPTSLEWKILHHC